MQHTQGNQYKRKQIWDVLTILDSSFGIFAILLFAPFCGVVSETPVGIIRCASSWMEDDCENWKLSNAVLVRKMLGFVVTEAKIVLDYWSLNDWSSPLGAWPRNQPVQSDQLSKPARSKHQGGNTLCLQMDVSVVGWERHQASIRVRELQRLCL